MPYAYDDQNIFAKILRGDIPSTRVYEDEETLAFMDIIPRADGQGIEPMPLLLPGDGVV